MRERGKRLVVLAIILAMGGIGGGCAAPRAIGSAASGVVKTAGKVASGAVKTTGKAVGAVTSPLRGGRR